MSATHSITDIQYKLGKDWEDLKILISESLISDIQLLNKINEHLFLSSGKMLRPLLSLLSAGIFNKSVSHISKVCAATSEIIHTATLLHDDVVDDSSSRRGNLTINALFSPGASVLMGDFWLSRAIHLLISNHCDYRILSYYSKTIEDLAEGEMLQMQRAEDVKTDFDDYINIITKKTASLFIASICSPAIAEGATLSEEEALKQYATSLGLSFQMRDDILDFSSVPLDGKDVGSDLAERKITLPLLCAFENAPRGEKKIRELISEIDVSKKSYSEPNNSIIKEIRNYVFENRGVESSKDVLTKYIQTAVNSLNIFSDSESKSSLIALARILNM